MKRTSTFGASPQKSTFSPSKSGHTHARQKSALPNFQFGSETSTPKLSLSSIPLYTDIESTLRKLDPSFKLFNSCQSPSLQIQDCIKQATHFLLQQQKRISKNNEDFLTSYSKSPQCEHCGKCSKNFSTESITFTQNPDPIKQRLKKFEKQKLIHSEKIKEEKKLLGMFKEKLEGLAERLSTQKQEILAEEKDLKRQKLDIRMEIGIQVLCEPRKKGSDYFCIETFPSIDIQSSFDFSSLIEELENQIRVYNDEIAVKENQLNEKEATLRKKEENLKRQLSDLELIILTLGSSKKDYYDLKNEVFPGIDIQQEQVKTVLKELNQQKTSLESILENFEDLVQGNESCAEFHYLRTETEKKYKENCEYNQYLVEMQEKLDKHYAEKNKELLENEAKLKKLQESVNLTIESMEKKEKELMNIGEKLKTREQMLMKKGLTLNELPEEASHETMHTPKYYNPIIHSRSGKSMGNIKKIIEN